MCSDLLKMLLGGFLFSAAIITFIIFLHKVDLHKGKGKALILVCLFFLAFSINHMINPMLDLLLYSPRSFTGKLTVIKDDFNKAVIYVVKEKVTDNTLESLALHSHRKRIPDHIQTGETIKVLYYPKSKMLAGIHLPHEMMISPGEIRETLSMYFNWSL